MNRIKELIQFFMAFSVVLFIVTFVLRIPQNLTSSSSLVNEYYFKNFTLSVPLDFILVYAYLQAAFYVLSIYKTRSLLSEIVIVALVTMVLTGSFCLYFLSQPKTSSFFSRWFHSAKYKTVIYDVILLVLTFITMRYLQQIS